MAKKKLKHWQLIPAEYSGSDVVELVLDKQNSAVNVLDSQVLDELDQVLTSLEQKPAKGLILSSPKAAGFLAGADVTEFQSITDRQGVIEKLERGQLLFLRFERLPFVTVALIHGHCLGGGLELALACDYRVADSQDNCKLGLPEVKLGIHPGYGGAVRLPRLIDDFKALTLMMAGRVVSGRAAKKLGMVDVCTGHRYLNDAAQRLISGQYRVKRNTSLASRLLSFKPLRALAAQIARGQLQRKVNVAHYPAPYRLLELWRDTPDGDEPAYRAEAESVARLFDDPVALRAIQNLVRIFLLDKEIKGRGKAGDFDGSHVHVIGAGVMGGDIAAWCAMSGYRVTLQDAQLEYIGPAIARAHKLFRKKLKSGAKVNAAMDRLIPDTAGDGVPAADLVIEAISEKPEAKCALYADIEPRMKESAILATNTSSIPLEHLAEKLARPGRLVGIHFFNPVAKMQLVEVVRGKNTSETTVGAALAFVGTINKLPLEVASAPGFLVNRVLMTYLSEAMRLLEEGAAPEVIDKLAVDFGMPMGPIELADTVGLDICQAVAHELNAAFGGEDSERLKGMVDQGRLGRKAGEGFYKWQRGKPIRNNEVKVDASGQEAADRMIYSMLNESVQCLEEGVVADADALDLGMIFGTGFPPFQGGPIQFINTTGVDKCTERLATLAETAGPRFNPKPGWKILSS